MLVKVKDLVLKLLFVYKVAKYSLIILVNQFS